MAEIKKFIFDLEGVLTKTKFGDYGDEARSKGLQPWCYSFCKHLGIDNPSAEQVNTILELRGEWVREKDRVEKKKREEEYFSGVSKTLGRPVAQKDVDQFQSLVRSVINLPVFELAKQLKENGYTLAILTEGGNPIPDNRDLKPLNELGAKVYTQENTGFSKKTSGASRYVLETEGWQGKQTAMIDDNQKNLEVAATNGIVPILYKGDNAEFEAKLGELGVDYKAV